MDRHGGMLVHIFTTEITEAKKIKMIPNPPSAFLSVCSVSSVVKPLFP